MITEQDGRRMTFYNHIESVRSIAIDLTNGRKWSGARDKATVFDALDAARREYMRLSDENTKLREQADFEHFQLGEMKRAAGMMLDDFVALKNRNARLATEYAKLRKLFASTISNYVDGYMDDTSARYPCDLCDESSKQQCDYQHDRQCPFYKQLRELGVEVDE